MEAADQSAGSYAGGRLGENPLVCIAVEDRDVSQNSQIGLPRRTSQAADHRASDPVDCSVLHSELAGILDDDGAEDGS